MTRPETGLITTQMIEELSPSLLNLALRKVARREDAEDLVQETWIGALRSAPTFEGRSSLRTWLSGILARRIADRYRRERPSTLLDEEEHRSEARSPAEQHDWQEAGRSALGALTELSALERTAVTLCDLEDLDRDEAASRMQITRGYLRVLLCRARSKLELSLRSQGLDLELCA